MAKPAPRPVPSAEHMASELQEEFDLDYAWDGDVMTFKRPGIVGELVLDQQEVTLDISLGLMFFALKPTIEREAHRFFDENFPCLSTLRAGQLRPFQRGFAAQLSRSRPGRCIGSSRRQRPVPLTAAQASNLARPTMSVNPGRRPSTSPSTACLYKGIELQQGGIVGAFAEASGKLATAASNWVCKLLTLISPVDELLKWLAIIWACHLFRERTR
jgi:putative polyhydroxyalkanoate system protein